MTSSNPLGLLCAFPNLFFQSSIPSNHQPQMLQPNYIPQQVTQIHQSPLFTQKYSDNNQSVSSLEHVSKKIKTSLVTESPLENTALTSNSNLLSLLAQNQNQALLSQIKAMNELQNLIQFKQKLLLQSQTNQLVDALFQQQQIPPLLDNKAQLEFKLTSEIQSQNLNRQINFPRIEAKPETKYPQASLKNTENNQLDKSVGELISNNMTPSTLSNKSSLENSPQHSNCTGEDHVNESEESGSINDLNKKRSIRKKEKFVKKKIQPRDEPPSIDNLKKETLQLLSSMAAEIESLLGFGGIDHSKIYLLLTKNDNDASKAVTRVLRNRQYYRKFFALKKN